MDASTALAIPIPLPRSGAQPSTAEVLGEACAESAESELTHRLIESAENDAPGSSPTASLEARHGRGQEFEVILNELSAGAPFSAADRLITVDELERRYIERVLTLTSGNKSRAAQILGFDRRTLYRKIERYGRPL